MSSLELFHVTPRILCVRRPRYMSCSYIVSDEQGTVLVDAGMKPDGSDMLAGLAHLGIPPEDVDAILLTHWHNDHSSGAEAVRAISGARVYYHRFEHANFTRIAVGRLRNSLSALVPELGPLALLKTLIGQSPSRVVATATMVMGGETIEERFRAMHMPGHTAGHTAYLYAPDRALFAGDAIAVCNGRLTFMSRFLTEDRAAAFASMRTLAEEPAEILCPGHRRPLVDSVEPQREAMLRRLRAGEPWPMFS
jgi:glyoxylase-like metal-dependent hydrolase (beta-lactamase superfamily II)